MREMREQLWRVYGCEVESVRKRERRGTNRHEFGVDVWSFSKIFVGGWFWCFVCIYIALWYTCQFVNGYEYCEAVEMNEQADGIRG